ncbi:hypothetical protein N7490_000965 [Penicillium lividum]|nr:hypothetical protein N7490_000965 [Penicillium lividum]
MTTEIHPASAAVEQDDLMIPVQSDIFISNLNQAHLISSSSISPLSSRELPPINMPSLSPSPTPSKPPAFYTSRLMEFHHPWYPESLPHHHASSVDPRVKRTVWAGRPHSRTVVTSKPAGRSSPPLEETEGISTLRGSTPDLKETLEIGREGVENSPNRWPDHLDDEGKEFKEIMLSFFETCKNLHQQIMRAIALGMNLPEHFFDEFVSGGDNNLRLLHYPPVRKEVFKDNPNQVRAGEHSDYGSVTLLFQDRHGGLQVRSPKGTFVDVTPIADAIVVNAGDLMARWSNDTITSTRHRVIQPPIPAGESDDSDSYPARYSIAYFCNPNNNKLIEALPGTYGENVHRDKKYADITAGDYLVSRLTATI